MQPCLRLEHLEHAVKPSRHDISTVLARLPQLMGTIVGPEQGLLMSLDSGLSFSVSVTAEAGGSQDRRSVLAT